MTGERDEKFCRIAVRVCASWPAAEPVVVTAAGHRVPWEQPELFQRVVRDFLEKHFPAKS
jgi:2-succinyl-6-hydroxy-2,4-cyclohexadiene-1-carboxylate synthase